MSRVIRRPDYYNILGVAHDAQPETIEAAYRALMLRLRDEAGEWERARQVRLAHRVLGDPENRARYDRSLTAEDVPASMTSADPPAASAPRNVRVVALTFVAVAAGGALAALVARPSGLERPVIEPRRAGIAAAVTMPVSGQRTATATPPGPARIERPISGLSADSRGATFNAVRSGPARPVAAPVALSRPSSSPRLPVPNAQASTSDAAIRTAEPAAVGPAQGPAPAPGMGGTEAHWISGGLVDEDNRHGRFDGTVSIGVTVMPDGRATNCRVTRSSGDGELDATTCRLLENRLRFAPARDAAGRPHVGEVTATHTWVRGRRQREPRP